MHRNELLAAELPAAFVSLFAPVVTWTLLPEPEAKSLKNFPAASNLRSVDSKAPITALSRTRKSTDHRKALRRHLRDQ